jgi:hypothetical protein
VFVSPNSYLLRFLFGLCDIKGKSAVSSSQNFLFLLTFHVTLLKRNIATSVKLFEKNIYAINRHLKDEHNRSRPNHDKFCILLQGNDFRLRYKCKFGY